MTYCKLAHQGLYVGTTGVVKHCCIQHTDSSVDNSVVIKDWSSINDLTDFYLNNQWLATVRNELDNGIKNPGCNECWNNEYNKLQSKRQRVNKEPFYKTSITTVDLRLSNKCNLQCKMCYPGASSQLANLAIELDSKGIKNDLTKTVSTQIYNIDNLLNLVTELPDLEYLRLAGGEPFIMPEIEEMLSKLLEKNKTNITIDFITNCTSAKTKVINLLEKFNKVILQCSIDATEEDLEYQRYPAKWSNIEKNFIKFYNSKCEVNLTPCISMLNFLNINKFLIWTEQFPKSRVSFNEVTHPSFLDFRLVPLENRKDLFNDLTKYSLKTNTAKNWDKFISTLMYQHKVPTKNECDLLKHYSQDIWDYRCNVKFLEKYPYMGFMINV
jgi:organic radical activating enzyme